MAAQSCPTEQIPVNSCDLWLGEGIVNPKWTVCKAQSIKTGGDMN